jgi:hypothetical protein
LPNQFAASLADSLPGSGLLRLLRCGQGAEEHLVEILHVGEQFLDVDDSLIDDHASDLARVRFVHLILDEGEEEVAHQSASLVLILGLTELLEVEALRQLPADLRALDGVGEVHLRLVHGLLLVPWLLLVVHLGLGLGLRLLVLVSLLLVLTLLALIVVATALIVVIATTTTALEVVASVVAAGAALAVLVLLLLVLPALRLVALVLLVVLTLVVVLGLGTLLLIVASLVLLAL